MYKLAHMRAYGDCRRFANFHLPNAGHSYYYYAATKKSTYTRPTQVPQPPLNPPFEHTAGALGPQHNVFGPNPSTFGPLGNHPFGQNNHYEGRGRGRGDQSNYQRPQPKDRPKKKHPIPDCSPWLLVQTKLGRRFVFNPDKGESYWKFSPDVMKGVVEFDRLEREKRMRKEKGGSSDKEGSEQAAAEAELAAAEDGIPTASAAPAPAPRESTQRLVDSDGEELEEVEVTDDEDDDEHRSKRQKTEDGDDQQPVEFNEDDIAYQLAAMGEDYGLDPGEYGDGEGEELEEGAEGLALTEEDTKALFKDMLNEFQINPYTTWEKVIEAGHIVEDDWYTVLPNMRSRKEVWDEWSRDRIQQLQEQRKKEEKKDPRIPYFAFLESYATPKLYWPEFRRKYRNEAEMRGTKISDKDREKWYRDYISRLKLPESTLKADLIKLLKSTPLHALNKSSTINALPSTLLTDLRYISVRKSIRDPLVEAHISTLPPAPTDLEISPEDEAQVKERQDRERREKALAERQKQVKNEMRRQRGALQYSKGMLREEEEVQKAMRVGKEGLLGHMGDE